MSQRMAPPTDAEITVGTNTLGVFPVVVQLKGQSGCDMKYSSVIKAYLSTDAAGDILATDSTDTTEMAEGADGTLIKEYTTDIFQCLKSEADGDIDLNITVASGKHAYLNVILPNGRVVTSTIMSYGE